MLERNLQAKTGIVVNQGGSGSSKSYSLAQLVLLTCLKERGMVFSIVRKALPTLKATAMKDLLNVLKENNLYSLENHNKSDHTYNLNGNTIEFFGLDDPQKARSRRRNYLWLNEVNEFSLEDFRQLSMRTSKRIYMDFNPSDMYSWIYDEVLPSKDCTLIVSTYKDNPFLPQKIVEEIEGYQDKDQNYWRVYGLGQRGVSETTVYTHWQLCKELPDGDSCYGLDFGFNHATALTKLVINDNDLYTKEIIYQTHITNSGLIDLMKELGVDGVIYADSEDPNRIAEIKQAGFNILPVIKGKNSVKRGIDLIKARSFYITSDSSNMIKEVKSYSWQTKDGKPTDEVVKVNDHAMDSIRYAVFSKLSGLTDPKRNLSRLVI